MMQIGEKGRLKFEKEKCTTLISLDLNGVAYLKSRRLSASKKQGNSLFLKTGSKTTSKPTPNKTKWLLLYRDAEEFR